MLWGLSAPAAAAAAAALNASARIVTLLTFLLLLPEAAAAAGEDFTPLGVGILLSLLALGDVMPSGETAACRAARGRIGILEGPRQLDTHVAAALAAAVAAAGAAAAAAAVPGLEAVVWYSAGGHAVNVSGSVSALRGLGFALEGGSVRGLGFALVKQLSVTQLLYTLSKPCCEDTGGGWRTHVIIMLLLLGSDGSAWLMTTVQCMPYCKPQW
jgi:hypothetical protein